MIRSSCTIFKKRKDDIIFTACNIVLFGKFSGEFPRKPGLIKLLGTPREIHGNLRFYNLALQINSIFRKITETLIKNLFPIVIRKFHMAIRAKMQLLDPRLFCMINT